MIIKRKLYSQVEEKMYARGTKEAGKLAKEFLSNKGNKVVNKKAKQLFEEEAKSLILAGPSTKKQYRNIILSGVTPNKHTESYGIARVTKGNDVLLNFESSIPTNHSINSKAISKYLPADKRVSSKNIMKSIHNDPQKGGYTRVRFHLD